MRCGSDIGKRCVAMEHDGKGRKRVSPDRDEIVLHIKNMGLAYLDQEDMQVETYPECNC